MISSLVFQPPGPTEQYAVQNRGTLSSCAKSTWAGLGNPPRNVVSFQHGLLIHCIEQRILDSCSPQSSLILTFFLVESRITHKAPAVEKQESSSHLGAKRKHNVPFILTCAVRDHDADSSPLLESIERREDAQWERSTLLRPHPSA